jgi:hypothetical protein
MKTTGSPDPSTFEASEHPFDSTLPITLHLAGEIIRHRPGIGVFPGW